MVKGFQAETEDEVLGYMQSVKENEGTFKQLLRDVGPGLGAIDDPFNIDMNSVYENITNIAGKDPNLFKMITRDARNSGVDIKDKNSVDALARKLYAKYKDEDDEDLPTGPSL